MRRLYKETHGTSTHGVEDILILDKGQLSKSGSWVYDIVVINEDGDAVVHTIFSKSAITVQTKEVN